MIHNPYNPTVHLLCRACRKPTAHTMIDFLNNPLSALTLVYECQECGEIKTTYDLNTLPEPKAEGTSQAESKQTDKVTIKNDTTSVQAPPQMKASTIPIEKGPQINR